MTRLLPGTEMVRSKEEGIQICDHYSSLLRMVEGHINTELKAAVRSAVDSDSLRLEDVAVGALAEARQVLASAERVFAGPRPRSVSSLQRQARIPPERPAPIRVEVREGKLRTANPKSSRGPMTAESVRRMLTSALETLSGALDSIRASSNVDRRFVPACEPLLRHLSRPYGEISVEALGHNWELVTDLLKGHRETIPDVPFTQIEQALRTVSVLINQYEEWRSYVAAQSIAGLSAREAQAAVYEAGAFAQELESHPESVDPEIVTRLKELVAPVRAAARAARAATIHS